MKYGKHEQIETEIGKSEMDNKNIKLISIEKSQFNNISVMYL
jgi:hypothetical protein